MSDNRGVGHRNSAFSNLRSSPPLPFALDVRNTHTHTHKDSRASLSDASCNFARGLFAFRRAAIQKRDINYIVYVYVCLKAAKAQFPRPVEDELSLETETAGNGLKRAAKSLVRVIPRRPPGEEDVGNSGKNRAVFRSSRISRVEIRAHDDPAQRGSMLDNGDSQREPYFVFEIFVTEWTGGGIYCMYGAALHFGATRSYFALQSVYGFSLSFCLFFFFQEHMFFY